MPRAAFDDIVAVYRGPGTATPMSFRFTLNCRFVPLSQLSTQRPLDLAAFAYLTWNGTSLTVGNVTTTFPSISVDYSTADVIEYPPLSEIYFTVLRTEIVVPVRLGLVPYRRAWLTHVFFG